MVRKKVVTKVLDSRLLNHTKASETDHTTPSVRMRGGGIIRDDARAEHQ